jgi:hypothetical protein
MINAINTAASASSNNSNAVGQMSLSVDPSYNQAQMQQMADKLDELILALRR